MIKKFQVTFSVEESTWSCRGKNNTTNTTLHRLYPFPTLGLPFPISEPQVKNDRTGIRLPELKDSGKGEDILPKLVVIKCPGNTSVSLYFLLFDRDHVFYTLFINKVDKISGSNKMSEY